MRQIFAATFLGLCLVLMGCQSSTSKDEASASSGANGSTGASASGAAGAAASAAGSSSQAPVDNSAVAGDLKVVVDSLIILAQKGDCKSMAPKLVLRDSEGPDEWKRSPKYEDTRERVLADKLCAKLQALVQDMKSYDYGSFSSEKESEGEWLVWTMNFKFNDGSSESHALAFLKPGNAYLLGEVD